MEKAKMCATGYMWKIMSGQLTHILHNGKIGETYNIGGHNEWKNIDIIKELVHANG